MATRSEHPACSQQRSLPGRLACTRRTGHGTPAAWAPRTAASSPPPARLPACRNCRAILLQRSDRRKRELEDKGCIVKQRVGRSSSCPAAVMLIAVCSPCRRAGTCRYASSGRIAPSCAHAPGAGAHDPAAGRRPWQQQQEQPGRLCLRL
jgi:hypothetical protein